MTSVIIPQGRPSRLPAVDRSDRSSAEVRLRAASVTDTAAVLAMLGRCSATTLFHRFHGPSDGRAYTRALLEGHPGQETLVAWVRSVCVGFASLASDKEEAAHLGVLVEDAWQRRRVGSRLASALIDGAAARGITIVRADVLGEDRFMLEALRRLGPSTVSFGLGTYTVRIDLSVGMDRFQKQSPARRRRGTGLPIKHRRGSSVAMTPLVRRGGASANRVP